MRVNFNFTGFFNKRLVGSSIATMLLSIFFIASSFKEHSDPVLQAKQVNLIIRQIGHRLLLQSGDSTSRVLPVTERKKGTFLLRFENKFVFSHDSLMLMSQKLLPKIQFPSGYTVTVHDCKKGEIVYGFQLNNTSPDILACSGRNQPQGCYTIEFVFTDFYADVKQNKADIGLLTELVKDDRHEANPKHEELKVTEKLKSVKVDRQEDKSKLAALNTTTFGYLLRNIIYIGMLLLVCVALLIWRFGKNFKPAPAQYQNHAVIEESVPELPALGKLLFDVRGQHLLLGSEVIGLTDKECKVLELLHKNFGELIPRETLMQKVWIDEGVITGRSLDMFVSKLRKKLSSDPGLRITNVHGKGYKLEIIEERNT